MTRKRFIKLLMAEGYSRNEANELAMDVDEGFSYDELYCIHCAMPQIIDIIGRIKPAIEALVKGICEVIPTVVQIITEMLPVAVEAAKKLKATAEELEVINENN